MHDVLTIGIPLIVIIAGILFNRADSARIESRIDRIENRLDAMRSEFQQEFRAFYRTIGQHDARLDSIEHREA